MQDELAAEDLPVDVRILGVNGFGHESGNATICNGRSIPWLQDTAEDDVWTLWSVAYRDVLILDEDNVPISTFNLTANDLGSPAAYAALKEMLREAADARP